MAADDDVLRSLATPGSRRLSRGRREEGEMFTARVAGSDADELSDANCLAGWLVGWLAGVVYCARSRMLESSAHAGMMVGVEGVGLGEKSEL